MYERTMASLDGVSSRPISPAHVPGSQWRQLSRTCHTTSTAITTVTTTCRISTNIGGSLRFVSLYRYIRTIARRPSRSLAARRPFPTTLRDTMKITGIRAHLCHFPLPAMFSPSWLAGFPAMSNGCVIYRIQTDEGIEGVTAGPLIGDEARGLVNLLRLSLTGRDPTQVEDIVKILRSSTRQLGMRAWHVEPALWDIVGKAAGLPVFRLLGGARTRVRAYASTGELRSGEERAEDVAARIEDGFTAVKLRIRFTTVEED